MESQPTSHYVNIRGNRNFSVRTLAGDFQQLKVRGVSEVKQYPCGNGEKSTAKVITAKSLLPLPLALYVTINVTKPEMNVFLFDC